MNCTALPNIQFLLDGRQGLSAAIETERLHIRSVQATNDEYDRYASLFGDQDVMEKYATGEAKSRELVIDRIKKWVQRWQNRDPYSGFAIFKKDTKEFVGHIILGHGDQPGEAELAYLLHKRHWQQGYGSEAAMAIKAYALATIQEGYLLEDKPLGRIFATARQDNPASIRILQKLGMQYEKEEEKYGRPRHVYSLLLPSH